MSVRYNVQEFFGDTSDRARDFGFGVANAARRAFCAGWSAVPGAIVPNPGDAFVRGLASSLCRDFPQPPAPSPPWTGGQCRINYTVRYRRAFTQKSTGTQVDQTVTFVSPVLGPVTQRTRNEGVNRVLDIVNGDGVVVGSPAVNKETNDISFFGIVSVTPSSGGTDNCGNPPPVFPGGDYINEGDRITNENITVEGDRNISIPVSIAPIFEEDVCIGQFAFCVDVGDIRVNLDLGGVTLQLPGTGGGDSGGGGSGGDTETITNIDNRTTIIQQQQEDCCAAIQLAISQFRNDVNEEFNASELRQACIVGLIRFAAPKFPKFEDPIDERASGFSGLHGITRFVQPLRADSCFLVVNIEPTEAFNGRVYTLREEGEDVEAGFGHVEVSFFDGGVRPAAEAGVRVISARRTLIVFDRITSGNQIRLSLKGGLNYSVVDPGFRWRPLELPQCDEIVDPSP